MSLRSAALAVVGLLATRTASAEGVVVESYTGPRPDNAGRLLGPVLEELATRGFAVGYDGVGRKFEGSVSRPARTPAGMPGDFASEIERGHKAWINGRFEDAVAILSPLIETAHGNAAVVSQDPKLRAEVQRGLIDLALAQARQGDPPAANETMGELLRSFPDAVVSRAAHGPEAFELYEKTRKALAADGLGTLVVDVADSGTNLFLNEQYAKSGVMRRSGLYPGRYRVYATIGEREGRVYNIEVKAGLEAKLAIDIAFDSVLHVAPSWTGLAFISAEDRERLEATYAATFAKLVGAPAVAVVGVDLVHGRAALVGSLVSLETGLELRRASIPIDPEPSADRRRALARYLAGDDSARASLDIEEPGSSRQPPPPPRRSRWGVWKYVTTGLGLAAGGAGVYLLIQDGKCSSEIRPCPDLYEYTVPGWSLAGGGAALIGLGIVMFLTDDIGDRSVGLVPTRGGAIASVGFSF
jgi:hypothetical protein